jgi:hypothetical protein
MLSSLSSSSSSSAVLAGGVSHLFFRAVSSSRLHHLTSQRCPPSTLLERHPTRLWLLDTTSLSPPVAKVSDSPLHNLPPRTFSPQDVQLAEKEEARFRRARAPGHIASQDQKTHTRCPRRSHVDSSRRARVLRHPRGPQARQHWPTEHRHKCHEGQGQRKG